jgi:hypothetical protein
MISVWVAFTGLYPHSIPQQVCVDIHTISGLFADPKITVYSGKLAILRCLEVHIRF